MAAEVDKAIGRSKSDRRLMTTVDVGGRPAVTLLRGIARDAQREMLLVEARPRTGRTHQIRVTRREKLRVVVVHLAEEHTPILGDTAYGWQHMNRRYASIAPRPMSLGEVALLRWGRGEPVDGGDDVAMTACLQQAAQVGSLVGGFTHVYWFYKGYNH
eukprot:Skav211435  [mRNA]  locus=scaffold1591:48059:49838:- [translate_table: standard]